MFLHLILQFKFTTYINIFLFIGILFYLDRVSVRYKVSYYPNYTRVVCPYLIFQDVRVCIRNCFTCNQLLNLTYDVYKLTNAS